MPHDVGSVKCMKPIPSTSRSTSAASTSPLRFSAGRSIWVTSPVTTAFESKPRRVRNIFICSLVVFCASSRITKASFSVRPRMNASGATSMTPRSIRRVGLLEGHHVGERVVERAQVRVDLLRHRSRQEAELLAGLDRRTRQDDARDLVAIQRRDRDRHGEVGLAGAGGPEREHQVTGPHQLDVAPLRQVLGRDAPAGSDGREHVLVDLVEIDVGLLGHGADGLVHVPIVQLASSRTWP